MTNDERNPKPEYRWLLWCVMARSSFGFRDSFGFRHSSFGFGSWFMESPLAISAVHRDHELRNWSAGLRPGAIVTRQGLFAPDRSSALRFMGSPLGLATVLWDHEPD